MPKFLLRPFRFLVRTTSFLRKEIAEIMRQPRLILTLVLGPFLILALFGIGYRNQARALRTLFVAPPDSAITRQIQDYASNLGPQLIYMGTIGDEAEAKDRLLNGQVDVVILVPADAEQALSQNKQATFTLLHNEIDPIQVDYVKYFGQVYVDEVNRRLLQAATAQGQSRSSQVGADLNQARTSVQAMRSALQQGDAATARQNQRQLNSSLGALAAAVGANGSLMGETGQSGSGNGASNVQSALSDAQEGASSLSNIPDNQSSYSSEIQRLDKIDGDLASLQDELAQFQNVSPNVLVSPLRTQAQGIASVQPNMTDYFAPAVIVLLLQHLTVTFAALSIVRERQLGTMELFRVAPLSAIETLLGKYLSYLIFGGVMAAILSALVIYGLRVPMLGAAPTLRPGHRRSALYFAGLRFRHFFDLADRQSGGAVDDVGAAYQRLLQRLHPQPEHVGARRASRLVAAPRDLRHFAAAEHHAPRLPDPAIPVGGPGRHRPGHVRPQLAAAQASDGAQVSAPSDA